MKVPVLTPTGSSKVNMGNHYADEACSAWHQGRAIVSRKLGIDFLKAWHLMQINTGSGVSSVLLLPYTYKFQIRHSIVNASVRLGACRV